MLRSHLDWVRETQPPGALEELLARLPDEIRSGLSGAVLATSWYPFRWLVELDRAIARRFEPSDEAAVLRDLGRYSARENLSTTYKVFDRRNNHEFFENSTLLHRQFQDFGTLEYERTGERSGRMSYHDYPCYSPVFCASGRGYFEQCLVSHGATSVQVEEIKCQCRGDDGCVFEMRWE